MLGHFRMSIDEVIKFSLDLSHGVFRRQPTGFERTIAVVRGGNRYRSAPLIASLSRLAEEITGSKNKRFYTENQSSCKT